MKRDKGTKLDRAVSSIKERTPRWFWTQCEECVGDFKHESMFYFHVDGIRGDSRRRYLCKECCPTVADVLEKSSVYFPMVSIADVSLLRAEGHVSNHEAGWEWQRGQGAKWVWRWGGGMK